MGSQRQKRTEEFIRWAALLSDPVLVDSVQRAQLDDHQLSLASGSVLFHLLQFFSASPDQLGPHWAGWSLGARTKVHLGSCASMKAPPFHLSPTFQSAQTGEIWIGDSRAQATMANEVSFSFV